MIRKGSCLIYIYVLYVYIYIHIHGQLDQFVAALRRRLSTQVHVVSSNANFADHGIPTTVVDVWRESYRYPVAYPAHLRLTGAYLANAMYLGSLDIA